MNINSWTFLQSSRGIVSQQKKKKNLMLKYGKRIGTQATLCNKFTFFFCRAVRTDRTGEKILNFFKNKIIFKKIITSFALVNLFLKNEWF